MKKALTLILIIICTITCFGQSISKEIEQMSKQELNLELERFFKDAVKNHYWNTRELRQIINAGADVNHIFRPEDVSALFYVMADADKTDSSSLLETALEEGIPPHGTDKNGKTALMIELENQSSGTWSRRSEALDRLRLLLMYGAEISGEYENVSLLSYALVLNDNRGSASAMFKEAGAKRNLEDEWWLRAWRHLDDYSLYAKFADELKEEGIDVNMRSKKDIFAGSTDEIKGNGQTALMYLAYHRKYSHIRALLDLDADASLTDDDGRNALHYLALSRKPYNENDDEETARAQYTLNNLADLLTEAGADIMQKDNYSKTPIDYALENLPALALVFFNNCEETQKDEMARAFFLHADEKERSIVEDFISYANELEIPPVNPSFFPEIEFWTLTDDLLAAVTGKEYTFLTDGEFVYSSLYSGGMYHRTDTSGTYIYDENNQKILLSSKEMAKNPGSLSLTRIDIPSEIKILERGKDFIDTNIGRFNLGEKYPLETVRITAFISGKPIRVIEIEKEKMNILVDFFHTKQEKTEIITHSDLKFEIITNEQQPYREQKVVYYPPDDLLFTGGGVYKINPSAREIIIFKKLLATLF